MRYVPILIYGIIYGSLSILLGLAMTKFFKMPAWVTPAIAFNNTTSLPLLLVQSLAATKLLDTLDDSGDAVARAKSYFLVNSMVGNCLTFALGSKLLNEWNQDHPDSKPNEAETEAEINGHIDSEAQEAESANEETSLLPSRIVRAGTRGEYAAYKRGAHLWRRLPAWTQKILTFLWQFVSPPVIGAALGALIGLVPALHRLFFNSQEEGGYLNAWLTSALQNIGDLFAALQVVVVGVKLSTCLLRMKKGEENGKVKWGAFLSITAIRFVVWPAVSIGVIYLLATRTGWLDDDPILWFSMMLMPAGPPALLLSALADVSGAEEQEKLSIAKFLTVRLPIHLYSWGGGMLMRGIDRIRYLTHDLPFRGWEFESLGSCCAEMKGACIFVFDQKALLCSQKGYVSHYTKIHVP
jgi:predicted permease